MAAPSFGNANPGATDAGGAWSYTASSAVIGRVVIVQILQDGTTNNAISAVVGTGVSDLAGTANVWTQITGPNGDGSFNIGSAAVARQFLYIGRTTAVTSTISGANSTSEDLYIRSYEFINVSSGTTLATVIENSTAGSTANTAATDGTITDAGVTTLGPDRLALQFIGISDDNALAAFTGETGGDWTEAVAEYAESSGTDATIGLQTGTAYSVSYVGTPAGAGGGLLYGGAGTSELLAQSFTSPSSTSTATSVMLYAVKVSSPTDNLLVEIQTDSSGAPSGTTVGTGGSIGAASVSGYLTVSINATLSASTTYWIVMSRSGVRDTTNYLNFRSVTGGGGYAGGVPAYRDSGSWTTHADDYLFGVSTSAGGTIDGGTTTNSDATDGWGVVGFALIGTTIVVTYQPRYGFVHYNDPAIV